MKKISLRIMCAFVFCVALFGGATLAQAKSIAPLTNQLVILDVSSKGTTITVTSAIAEADKLPANITLLAPKFCTLKSFKAFNSKTGKDYSKLSYSKSIDKSTESQVTQDAYNAKLTKQRGVQAVFTCEPIISNEVSQHTVFGMGWTTKTDADTLTMGAIAPEGKIGIGNGISLLGVDKSGNRIYGKTFKMVKANKEYVLQMGFEKDPNIKNSQQQNQTQKRSFFQTKNALIIIVLGALMLVAIVILIVILIKGRKQEAFEDYDDEDDFEEEDEE